MDPPIVAMRINSDIIRWRQQGGRVLKTKIPAATGDKYVGLVMLFSTENGEPLGRANDDGKVMLQIVRLQGVTRPRGWPMPEPTLPVVPPFPTDRVPPLMIVLA